jgi:putative transposase
VKANQATHPVRVMCRLLKISASGFYAWEHRELCARAREDIALSVWIRAIHRQSKGAYGAPMIQAELAEGYGMRVGCKRVARLMKAVGLRGITPKRFVVTTQASALAPKAPDRLERRFTAERANQVWVADITYIPTLTGCLYLAMVLDVWSRRIVGWSMRTDLTTQGVLDALNMAVMQRQPSNVIHHSDHGCQYTSDSFVQRCQEAGVALSMGSIGDAYDNAMAESFFATLERELLSQRSFRNPTDARSAVFEWIEGWYNSRRRHSSIGRTSPINFERRYGQQHAA